MRRHQEISKSPQVKKPSHLRIHEDRNLQSQGITSQIQDLALILIHKERITDLDKQRAEHVAGSAENDAAVRLGEVLKVAGIGPGEVLSVLEDNKGARGSDRVARG